MELDESFNQSPQGGLEKIGYMSSNGLPGNCCKVSNKYLIGHVLRRQNGGSTGIQSHFFSLGIKATLISLGIQRHLSSLGV